MAEEIEPTDAENLERVFEDQITVTAGRQELASGDVLAPVTVITSDQIEELQPEKMADLFKMIPGVEVQGEGPFRGIPIIRGLSSNRVLILVDGQRLNNGRESTSFAGIQPALVNLAQVERVEVLRGPASVQYGSDAIGGVINIITRKADLGAQEFEFHGEAAFEYGTASESYQGRAMVNGAGKGMSFHIGASIEEADDYKAASGAAEDERYAEYVNDDDVVPNSGMKQKNIDASLSFLTGSTGVLKFTAESVRTEDVGFPGFDPVETGIDITFPTFDRDKIGAAWNSGPLWGLSDIALSTWYQKVDKDSVRNFDFPPYFFSHSNTRSEIDSFGFTALGIADLGINHLTFGLDFYEDELHDTAFSETSYTPPSDTVVVPDSTQRGIGLYIDDRISVSDRWTINIGLRGDRFSFVSDEDSRYEGEPFDVTDSAVAGNLGVIYSITEHVNLTGLIARGFRTPNIQERSFFGLATTGDTFIIQNPDLESESSWNYEFGFKARYDRHSGGLHFFYNDLTDFIAFEFIDAPPNAPPIPNLDFAQFNNVAKAKIMGVELDLEVLFARYWSFHGSFAYLRGDNESTGEPLSSIPPWKVITGVRYQRSKWWSEADVRFVGNQERLPSDDPKYPDGNGSFTVFDLRGGYEFDFGLGVLVSLNNIFDELYSEPFNNRPEPGINLRATVRYRF